MDDHPLRVWVQGLSRTRRDRAGGVRPGSARIRPCSFSGRDTRTTRRNRSSPSTSNTGSSGRIQACPRTSLERPTQEHSHRVRWSELRPPVARHRTGGVGHLSSMIRPAPRVARGRLSTLSSSGHLRRACSGSTMPERRLFSRGGDSNSGPHKRVIVTSDNSLCISPGCRLGDLLRRRSLNGADVRATERSFADVRVAVPSGSAARSEGRRPIP